MFETAVPRRHAPGQAETEARSARWALVVAVLGSSMAFLDGTVVNVALPIMQRDLGATVAGAQWIVEAYALLLAALVLVGGALGDRLGRRSVFSAGVVLFALASMACGLAPGIGVLIAARAVQGIGAALLVPGSLALISAAFPERTRGAAIGAWSAWSAIIGAAGPVLGGWVASQSSSSWRWLFFFNVPLAAVIVIIAHRRVAESRDCDAPRRLDLAGAALATLALALIVYALLDSERGDGVIATRDIALLIAGAAALAAFIVVESRVTSPMVPLALFRSRIFAGTNLLTLLLYAALGAAMFSIPFDLIQVQHYSPAAAGAALLPFVLLVSLLSRWAGALAARVGPSALLGAGPLITAAGFVLLALPATGGGGGDGGGGGYWTTVFPGVLALGLGMGLTVAPLTAAVMGAVDARHAGVASGINNAVARTAGLLAVAGLGVLLLARFNQVFDGQLQALAPPAGAARVIAEQRARLGAADFSALGVALREPLRAAVARSYLAAFRTLMLACAGLAALAGLAGLALGPGRSPRATAEADLR